MSNVSNILVQCATVCTFYDKQINAKKYEWKFGSVQVLLVGDCTKKFPLIGTNSTNWVQNWCSLSRKFILIRTNSNNLINSVKGITKYRIGSIAVLDKYGGLVAIATKPPYLSSTGRDPLNYFDITGLRYKEFEISEIYFQTDSGFRYKHINNVETQS